MASVPRIRQEVRASHIQEDSLAILTAVRPLWMEASGQHGPEIFRFKFKVLSGGITNKLYTCSCDKYPNDVLVIKLYGARTDLLIDRPAEIEYMTILGQHRCGPELYATFNNGTCFEFLPGSTLTMSTCRSPSVYPLVASVMARLHRIPGYSGPSTGSQLWSKMRLFLDLLEKDVFVNNLMLRNLLAKDFGFSLNKIITNVNELEKILKKQNIPVALCHNDLLLGNVMYDETQKKVTFIDFEYAMPNYIAFDVANHFIEFAGLENPNFERCPNATFRRVWIQEYLKVYTRGRKCKIEFTQGDFERWVYLCTPASHLFWALWAAVQADKSEISFDYVGYAGTRYKEFEKCMTYIRGEHIYKRLIKTLMKYEQ